MVDADFEGRKLHLFEAPARGEVDKRVVVEEGVMTPVGLTRGELLDMSRVETLPARQREALAKVVGLMDEEARLKAAIDAAQKAKAKAEARVAAGREDLRAVPETRGRSRMVERILSQIVEAQDDAAARGDAIERAQTDLAGREEAARKLLEGLRPGDAKPAR